MQPIKLGQLALPIIIGMVQSLEIGQLAQLVQSTSFTPRGSGVRIPHCPHNP